jgi:hypothetical protein
VIIHVGSRGPSQNGSKVTVEVAPFVDELEQMRGALELGLGDYVRKNGFREVVVGVSGGIDSAVTAALAAEALGPERVHCVSMPSRYSSEETRSDARRLADELGAEQQRLLPCAEHQVAPADSARESQVVADHRGGPGLPADRAILENYRAKPLGGAVQSGGQARRPGSHDDKVVDLRRRSRVHAKRVREVDGGGLVDHGTVVEDHSRQSRNVDVMCGDQLAAALGLRRIEAMGNSVARHRLA